MNVHIIMTDDYSPKLTVAFLDRAEAEAAAASIHGLSQERISSRICEVPLLAFARMPSQPPRVAVRADLMQMRPRTSRKTKRGLRSPQNRGMTWNRKTPRT